mgnify:CR=1 FL=1
MDYQFALHRLRDAVALFKDAFGRVPTVAFDADGVINPFEEPYLEYHNRRYPHLQVTGPFERFDVGYGLDKETAEALQDSMRNLDWSTIPMYEEALELIPAIMNAGVDLSVCTSHRTDNLYSASAKFHRFHVDFDGLLDKRVTVTLDKTRHFADFLVDDKPEVEGEIDPFWEHIVFDRLYNRHITDRRRADWTNIIDVLVEAITAKAEAELAKRVEVDVPFEVPANLADEILTGETEVVETEVEVEAVDVTDGADYAAEQLAAAFEARDEAADVEYADVPVAVEFADEPVAAPDAVAVDIETETTVETEPALAEEPAEVADPILADFDSLIAGKPAAVEVESVIEAEAEAETVASDLPEVPDVFSFQPTFEDEPVVEAPAAEEPAVEKPSLGWLGKAEKKSGGLTNLSWGGKK